VQLLECIVKKPGLLENTNLSFDKRISIIYGKNESGKSLIAKGLIDTIWGEFSGSFSLNGNAWDDLYIEILFANASGRYKFIKNKKDNFLINFSDLKESGYSSEREIIKRINKNENQNTDGALCAKLYETTNDGDTARLFNIVNTQTFINSSFLADPADLITGKLDYNIIRQFLLNDNSNFHALYDNLTESLPDDAQFSGSSSISGEILKIESELQKIEKKAQIAGIHTAKSDRLGKEKLRLETELENYQKELSLSAEYKTKILNIHENLKKLNLVRISSGEKQKEKQTEQDKIEAISKMEQEIKEKYPQFNNFEESNLKNLKKIQEAYREVRDVHEKIENFYLVKSKKKNRLKNIIIFINIFSIILLAALFGISSFAYPLQIINDYKFQFIIGLLTLSISSSAFFLLYYIIASRLSGLNRIMKEKSDVEQKLAETLQKNSITLNEYKLETIYEYLVKYFEEYGEFSINQSELSTMKEGLKDGTYINSIELELGEQNNEEKKIRLEIENSTKFLAADDIIDLNDPIEINIEKSEKLLLKNNQKTKSLNENITKTANIISNINEEINRGIIHTEEMAVLTREKDNLQNALSRSNKYKITIEYFTNLLKDATFSRAEKQLAELVKTTVEYFHYLTDNQYINSIDDGYIKKVIKCELPAEEINRSLLYILQLSVKFAMTNSLTNLEINLPLIIDNPFLQMDDQRVIRLKDLVNEIADKRQIIIFTHSGKHKDWGTFLEL
jgi:uncharacterized protein YhaN